MALEQWAPIAIENYDTEAGERKINKDEPRSESIARDSDGFVDRILRPSHCMYVQC